MATIRFESVVTSQTATATFGYYKVYVTGNPSSTAESGIIPILMRRKLASGAYTSDWGYPVGYPTSYVTTYKNESELYLYPDDNGYYTSSGGTYNLEVYGVAWKEGLLDVIVQTMRAQYGSYFQAGYNGNNPKAEDYFTNFYVYSTATPLSTPIGLNATNITSNSALVSWAQNANASNFKIEYKINGDTSWTQTTSD